MSLINRIVLSFVALSMLAIGSTAYVKSSDSFIRNRTVQLLSENGSCTGVRIIAPSRQVYILTAAHCRVLLSKDNTVQAVEDNGSKETVSFVAEDTSSDLMLLSTKRKSHIGIADSVSRHDNIHTITHGHAMPLYRTDGEIIFDTPVMIPIFAITGPDEYNTCTTQIKYKVMVSMEGAMCSLNTLQTKSTALVVPGSSGGPAVDIWGNLVGIVSATDGTFSTFVRLVDIKSFLQGK